MSKAVELGGGVGARAAAIFRRRESHRRDVGHADLLHAGGAPGPCVERLSAVAGAQHPVDGPGGGQPVHVGVGRKECLCAHGDASRALEDAGDSPRDI